MVPNRISVMPLLGLYFFELKPSKATKWSLLHLMPGRYTWGTQSKQRCRRKI